MEINYIKALLIDENKESKKFILEMLKNNEISRIYSIKIDVISINSITDAFKSLKNNNVDIILLSQGSEEKQVLTDLNTLVAHFSNIPIIFLCNSNNEPLIIESLKTGASDFLLKNDLNSNFIIRSIRNNVHKKKVQESTAALKHTNELLKLETIERNIALEAMRESEELFRTLTATAPSAIFITQGLKILYVNTKAEEIIGYSKAELQAMQLTDFIHPQYKEKIINQNKKRLMGRDVQPRYEIKIIRKNNQEAWIDISIGTFQYLNSKSAIYSILDITSRKKVEDYLKESESRLRKVLEATSDGVWDYNLSTGNIFISRSFYRILGYSVNDITVSINRWKELIHPEDFLELTDHFINHIKGYTPQFKNEYRVYNKLGQWQWLLMRGMVVEWEIHGKAKRIVGTITDISERKNAEETLRESEVRFKTIAERAYDIILILDDRGNFIYISPSVERIIGYKPVELIGKNYKKILIESKDAKAEQTFIQLQEGKNVEGLLFDIKRKDTSLITVEVNVSKIMLNGRAMGLGIARDITERKQNEEELHKAKEAAERANKAKSDFLANMSHELRTPLNGILGYAQILKRDSNLSESQKNGLDVIESSGNYLLNLINDILDLSKIEAHRMEIHKTIFHLHDFLDGIVQMIRFRIQEKGVLFHFEDSSHLPDFVFGDEKCLSQVLFNLLGNAIKFTEQGSISLKVGYIDSKIRFIVEDTGIGISEDQLQKIFSPFTQAEQHHLKIEGTGLGLAISQSLVQLMGGVLQVESIEGKGSKFWFDIELPVFSGYNMKMIAYKGRKRKILIVDNDIDNRKNIVSFLTILKFEIEEININDAKQKVELFKPDLIFIDLVFLDSSNLEIIREIRNLPDSQDIVIISLFPNSPGMLKRKVKEAGCNDFILKPIKLKDVLHMLEKYLKLEWLYDEHEVPAHLDKSNVKNIHKKIKFPLEEAHVLYMYAKRGDIKSFLKKLEDVEKMDSTYINFVQELRRLANSFQINKIRELLSKVIEIK